MVANVIVIIGAAIQAASFDYWQMFVARIIAGTGVGLSTVAVPILQSETLPARKRGSLLVVQSALIIIGVAIASWLCYATLYADSSMQWRFPVACQCLFSAIVLCCCPFICETPRWLAKHGRQEEARSVIARLLDKQEMDPEVSGQLEEILENIALEESSEEPSWREVFSQGKAKNLQRVLLGMGPYMMNQWSGINSVRSPIPLTMPQLTQSALLLPWIYPPDIPWILTKDVSDSRLSRVHSICCLFLATISLHRQNWPTMDSHWIISWVCSLYGNHCRMSPFREPHWSRGRCRFHLHLSRLLHPRHLTSVMVILR